MPSNDSVEDELHGAVVKLIDGDGIEVPEESRSDGVTPTTRGTHSSDKENVNKVDLHGENTHTHTHTHHVYVHTQ